MSGLWVNWKCSMKPSEMNILGIIVGFLAILVGMICIPWGIPGIILGTTGVFINYKKYLKHKRMGY